MNKTNSDLQQISERLQRIEDLEAIRGLKAQYATILDESHGPGRAEAAANKVADLFTRDGIWDGGPYGKFIGKPAIAGHFRDAAGKSTKSTHFFVMPSIEIAGTQARARWYLCVILAGVDGNTTVLSGFEDDEYVKLDSKWLITSLKATLTIVIPAK